MTKSQLLELDIPLGNPYPIDGDRRRYDPVTAMAGSAAIGAGSAAIGAGGNLLTGILGNSAAKKAAEIQAKAGQAAADKVGVATGQANTGIADATQNAQGLATAGGQRVVDTAGAAAQGATDAAGNANALLNPYAQAGSTASGVLNAGIAEGGAFNHAPTLAELQMDPGYAFRLQQGQQELERSAAARGGALGGGAAQEMAKYSQGLASQEYQNAFNRFQTSTQNRFSNVMGVSNAGQNAAGQQGQNLTQAAQFGGTLQTGAANTMLGANEFAGQAGMTGANQIGQNLMGGAESQGNFTTGAANARASGIVGGQNALSAGIAGGTNAISNAAMLNLLVNPATKPKLPSVQTLAGLPQKAAPFALSPFAGVTP